VTSGAKFGAVAEAAGLHEGGCDGVLERLARTLVLHRWHALQPPDMAQAASKLDTSALFTASLSLLKLPCGEMASALLDGLLGSKRCSPAEAMALADFTAVSGAILEGRAASAPVEGMPLHLDLIDKLFRVVIPATLTAEEALPVKAWGEIAALPVETSVVAPSHLARN